MSRTLALLFTSVAALALATSAAAAPLDPSAWSGRLELGTFESTPGESLQAFLTRVGPTMSAFTRKTHFESCATIAAKGDRFSVMLKSDSVQLGCALSSTEVLEGYTATGETIHSHPKGGHLWLTDQDRAWAALYLGENDAGIKTVSNDPNGGFSDADIAGGPGWLVSAGRLYHQTGPGTARKVGWIKE